MHKGSGCGFKAGQPAAVCLLCITLNMFNLYALKALGPTTRQHHAAVHMVLGCLHLNPVTSKHPFPGLVQV